MNDVIIGVALGSLIRDNRGLFLTVTETFVRVRSDRKSRQNAPVADGCSSRARPTC